MSEYKPDVNVMKDLVANAKADLENNSKKDVITRNCSVNEALFFLHAAFHLPNAHEPEYAVFNPAPQHFVKGFLLPRDMYFWAESNRLSPMDLGDFKKACKGYIRNKSVKHISTVVSLDKEDKLRLTAIAEFHTNGNNPTSATMTFTVSGGMARECELALKKTYGILCQAVQNNE